MHNAAMALRLFAMRHLSPIFRTVAEAYLHIGGGVLLMNRTHVFEYKAIESISISITSSCILKCPSCPTGRKNFISQQVMEYMPVNLFENIVRHATEMYGNVLFYLHIYNEPLVHPHIFELLSVLNTYGQKCYISSNINMKIDWEKLLKNTSLQTLVISASGYSQEVYSRGHRGGNVGLVLKNITEIGKYIVSSSTKVIMNFHRYNDNAEESALMREICYKNGIIFGDYDAIAIQDRVDESVLCGRELWKENSDVIDNVLPRLFHNPFKFVSIKQLQSVPCHLQRYTLSMDHAGQIFTCFCKGPDDPNRIGDFLSLSREDIFAAKAGCAVCDHCRKHGLHLQYSFASFFDKRTKCEQIMDFLRSDSVPPAYRNVPIYLFGCGIFGGMMGVLLRHKGLDVRGIIDESPLKCGRAIYGIPISSPADVEAELPGSTVIDTVRALPARSLLTHKYNAGKPTVVSMECFIANYIQEECNDSCQL